MCIRDRYYGLVAPIDRRKELANLYLLAGQAPKAITLLEGCLLYTSDAADERSSVDLGGRRIIKKKQKVRV